MHPLRTEIELAGTKWPIPEGWTPTSEYVFQGREGLLKLSVEDGALIDPGRCLAARDAQPGLWQLARTRNGTGLLGDYRDRQARVVVCSVRADTAHWPVEDQFSLPEIQATYVLVENEEAIANAVRESLAQRVIPPSEFGPLDEFGHAAMGPVPILGGWLPVGDWTDKTGTPGTAQLPPAYPMLIGGGWLVFTDAPRCCGVMLEPLTWRRVDEGRALGKLELELHTKSLIARRETGDGARVWQCKLSEHGFSYSAHDPQGILRARGAFWTDAFGQTWRVHYWLHPEHGDEAERLLAACKADAQSNADPRDPDHG